MKLPAFRKHGAVVCYEDPQRAFERSIFPLLRLSPTPIANRRFLKQTHRLIEEIVENYDEVEGLLNAPEAFQDYKLDCGKSADS